MDIKQISAQLRQVKNITDFARRSGVSRATLNRMLVGWNNPTFKTLEKIEAQLRKESK